MFFDSFDATRRFILLEFGAYAMLETDGSVSVVSFGKG